MWFIRHHRQNFATDERGVAMIEMAVVLPVLLAIGLGVIEFGNAIFSQHLIANGVRDAARYIAGLPQVDADDNSLRSVNEAPAKSIALTGETSGTNYRVSWWNDPVSMVTITYDDVANDDGSGGQLYRGGNIITTVTVEANVPYQQLGFLAFFGLSAPTLRVSHQERVYGVR